MEEPKNEEYYTLEQSEKIRNLLNSFKNTMAPIIIISVSLNVIMLVFKIFDYFNSPILKLFLLISSLISLAFLIIYTIILFRKYKRLMKELKEEENA